MYILAEFLFIYVLIIGNAIYDGSASVNFTIKYAILYYGKTFKITIHFHYLGYDWNTNVLNYCLVSLKNKLYVFQIFQISRFIFLHGKIGRIEKKTVICGYENIGI